MPDPSPRLQDFVLLGRSGLRASRLSLGTMTFGTEWGWGSADSPARWVVAPRLEAGALVGSAAPPPGGTVSAPAWRWWGSFAATAGTGSGLFSPPSSPSRPSKGTRTP